MIKLHVELRYLYLYVLSNKYSVDRFIRYPNGAYYIILRKSYYGPSEHVYLEPIKER